MTPLLTLTSQNVCWEKKPLGLGTFLFSFQRLKQKTAALTCFMLLLYPCASSCCSALCSCFGCCCSALAEECFRTGSETGFGLCLFFCLFVFILNRSVTESGVHRGWGGSSRRVLVSSSCVFWRPSEQSSASFGCWTHRFPPKNLDKKLEKKYFSVIESKSKYNNLRYGRPGGQVGHRTHGVWFKDNLWIISLHTGLLRLAVWELPSFST